MKGFIISTIFGCAVASVAWAQVLGFFLAENLNG